MQTLRFKTNLTCDSCVSAVRPLLDRDESISSWRVDTDSPDKPLTVEGDRITPEQVSRLVGLAGFRAVEIPETHHAEPETNAEAEAGAQSFYPLALILAYLLGVVALAQLRPAGTGWMPAMSDFMAGFFLVFSFFKLLDLGAFASAYRSYDVVARRWAWYGYAYPFIELALGVAYLVRFVPTLTNVATIVVMGVGSVGVIQTLMGGRKIRCACLGTVFNLPMTTVTVVEDLLMVVMAVGMLLAPSFVH